MLDAYIIDDIRRQEEARRRADEERRPRLHIERDPRRADPDEPTRPQADPEDATEEPGGVVYIERR